MHAKAYIGKSLSVIGSANFSRAGLRHNLELVEASLEDDSGAFFGTCRREGPQRRRRAIDAAGAAMVMVYVEPAG
jgi:hypothetical protein